MTKDIKLDEASKKVIVADLNSRIDRHLRDTLENLRSSNNDDTDIDNALFGNQEFNGWTREYSEKVKEFMLTYEIEETDELMETAKSVIVDIFTGDDTPNNRHLAWDCGYYHSLVALRDHYSPSIR